MLKNSVLNHMTPERLGKFLWDMDGYIREHVNDEDLIIGSWFSIGIPDGADLEECIEIARDLNPEIIVDIFYSFAKCVMRDSEYRRAEE